MKMRDIFGEQGVKVGRDNTTIIDPVDLGEWGDFAAPETAMAAAHAINNHDALVNVLKLVSSLFQDDDFIDFYLHSQINEVLGNAEGK